MDSYLEKGLLDTFDPELIWCWSSSAGVVSAMQLAIVALMATTLPRHRLPSENFPVSITAKASTSSPKDFIVLKRSSKLFPAILWAFPTCSESGELIGFRLRGHWRGRLLVHVGPILVSKLAYRLTPVTNFSVQNLNSTTTVSVRVC